MKATAGSSPDDLHVAVVGGPEAAAESAGSQSAYRRDARRMARGSAPGAVERQPEHGEGHAGERRRVVDEVQAEQAGARRRRSAAAGRRPTAS